MWYVIFSHTRSVYVEGHRFFKSFLLIKFWSESEGGRLCKIGNCTGTLCNLL